MECPLGRKSVNEDAFTIPGTGVKQKVASSVILCHTPYIMRKLTELTQYRAANSLSRQDLADQFGVSAVTIWRWEAGERFPSLRHLPAVAKMVGKSIEDLIVGDQTEA